MLRIAIDARSAVTKKSGIGNYVEALVRHILPVSGDMRFTLLRHSKAEASIVQSERVTERSFPGETKSVGTVFGLGFVNPFADHDLYHSPADLVPLGLRCPWVVTIHDLMWLEAPELAASFLPVRLVNQCWYSLNIARAVRGASAIIAISHATRDAIARVFPEQVHKVTVIHHGLDADRYSRARAKPRSELSEIVPEQFRYSLIVGQGSPYKNHAGMIRAFIEATHDEPLHKLVLVRRFSRFDAEMRHLFASPGLRDKLVVVPFVPDDVLLALYRHAHMLLFASHYEGFGLPALEAMAVGTPVLASTAPAVREITGEAALHARSDDPSDLVRKMRELSTEPKLRHALIEAGTRRVRDFSWERSARAHFDVYRKAAALGRGPR